MEFHTQVKSPLGEQDTVRPALALRVMPAKDTQTVSPGSNCIMDVKVIFVTVAIPERFGSKDTAEFANAPTPWTKLRDVGSTGPFMALVEIRIDD